MKSVVISLLVLAVSSSLYAGPVPITRAGIHLDVKKNETGKFVLAGTGKILIEDVVSSESDQGVTRMEQTMTCEVPVTVKVIETIPAFEDALAPRLAAFYQNETMNQPGKKEERYYTSSYFGFRAGKAGELKKGLLNSFTGVFTPRPASQLQGIAVDGIVGIVNRSGVGMALPLGNDFKSDFAFEVEEAKGENGNALCRRIKKDGWVVKTLPPVPVTRAGLRVDITKTDASKFSLSGTGTILLEDKKKKKTCEIPVLVKLASTVPGAEDSLSQEVSKMFGSEVKLSNPETDGKSFTAGYFGFRANRQVDLKKGSVKDLTGHFDSRGPWRFKGENRVVLPLVNARGLGVMLPFGNELKHPLSIEVTIVSDSSQNEFCQQLEKSGWIMK